MEIVKAARKKAPVIACVSFFMVPSSTHFLIYNFKQVWDLVASFRNLEEYSRFFHDNDDAAPANANNDDSTLHVHMFSSDFSRNLRKPGSRFQVYCVDLVRF